jgi:isoamylase
MNAHFESQWVQLPPPRDGKRWLRVVDTSLTAGDDFMEPGHEVVIDPPDHYIANPRSTIILVAR